MTDSLALVEAELEKRLQLRRLVEEGVGPGIEGSLSHGVSRVVSQDGDSLTGLPSAGPFDDAQPVTFLQEKVDHRQVPFPL